MTFTLQRISESELQLLANEILPDRLASRLADGALPPPVVAQTALDHLRAGEAEPWCSVYHIVRDEDGVVSGGCGFKHPPREGEVEIGYGVSPAWQNHGAGTTAVRELCKIAFASERVQIVLAQINPENLPSSRVAQKLNFVRGDVVIDADGEWLAQWRLIKPAAATA
ncbi:MAG: GNAT family N-acetyltransferase [Anaerolineales bacterium]|nr:GNAT family N-acetyltransferase [Anaerolineales bacterium]